MNPALPLPFLIPLLTAVLLLGGWLSWRGSVALAPSKRSLLLGLRLLAFLLLAAILFNPGKWIRPTDTREKPWLVLLDNSASMNRELGESTRFDAATSLANSISEIAEDKDVPLRFHTFSSSADPTSELAASKVADPSKGTDLITAAKTLAEESAANGESIAGWIILSDGRQTSSPTDADLESLALRLRSRQSPLHAVAIGAGETVRDLQIHASRPTVTVFAGQTARIPFVVESSGLGSLRPEIILRDEAGDELARTSLEVSDGKPAFATLDIPAPESAARWTLETDVVPGEDRPGNNRCPVNLRLLESKTRVFLAEGAPYWDSKFLAQLLRQQTHMEVHSVHRLSEERFFRIDSGDTDAAETDTAIFPETLDELARYDLIIFGKNVDSFLDPARLDALRSYVRDRGGAVLFARGKATTSSLPALEALEPVTWGAANTADFRFTPAADGEAAGLFGEALPAVDASVWNALPTLKDARQVSFVKPFTRVLAEGVTDAGAGISGSFPTLLVRRYGQGVCGLVNGDGLWKWDFYPEARELGNMYEDFWTQLIQWMASYSEFLPGQDFSLRLPSSRGRSGEPVTLAMSFRGRGEIPQPVLRIEAPDGTITDLKPAARPDAGGHPDWRASFTPDAAGAWKLGVIDPRENAPPTPEASFLIPSPAAESDDLSPDPLFLASLAESTGGALHSAADLPTFLNGTFTPTPPSEHTTGAIWNPLWSHWLLALLITFFLASEWFLRRRQGLA